MSQQPPRRGLGRGLGSLIPTAPTAPPEPASPALAGTTTVTAPSPAGRHLAPSGEQQPGDGAATSPEPSAPAESGSSTGGTTPSSTSASDEGQGASAEQPPVPVGAYFAELPVSEISPNPRQPRQVFDEDAMAELVHSVKEIGLLQPVVVRRTGENAYELIMGERRWRATKQAGLDTIPAIVRETDDDDMLRDALLENLHRSQLNPLEEAAAYQQLLDDFGCTHDELAGRIGRSRPQISNTLRLLRLSPAVQRRVAAGVLSAGHARALLAVTEPESQDKLAARVVAEGISVRGLEELVAVGTGEEDQPKRPRRTRPAAPGLAEIGERIGDRLDTRVKVQMGKNKGTLSIEFASLGDLERIVGIIDPRNRNDRPI